MSNSPKSSNGPDDSPERDREIFLGAIAGRKPTMADLIGQAGGNFLKGESPVPKMVQIKAELKRYLSDHLSDSEGALLYILQNKVEEADALISHYAETPLQALQQLLDHLLQPGQLTELVHQADFRWGQIYGERPHFNVPGRSPYPDDPYTEASMQQQLETLHQVLERESL